MTRAHNAGAALVAAMLVAALAAAVVATLASSQSQWLRTVELRRDQVQAQALVLAGLAWSRQIVALDGRAGPIDHLGEPWAFPLPPTPLDNGSIEGRIVDAQAGLNLNDLADAPMRARVAPLFAREGLALPALDALAQATAETPLTRPAEATLVRGVDEARFARLADHVTALPAKATINVNTAPPEVLSTLVSGLNGDALAALVADRARRPFASVAEFRSRLPSGAKLDEAGVGVSTDYFLVTVTARQGETLARGRALLHRRGENAATVVWQTIE
jgi:general secretion pathway protein K